MGLLSSLIGGGGGGKSPAGATNQQVTASDAAQVFTGDDAKNVAAGASLVDVGTLTDNSKGVDISGASLGAGANITIGDPGLGTTFADTVRALAESQSSAFTSALSAQRPLPPIDQPPGAASSATPGTATEWIAKIKLWAKEYWWALALAAVAAVAWVFWRRK